MGKPIPKRIGKVEVKELGNNLLKLSSTAWSPNKDLFAALVEIQKIRIVTHFSYCSSLTTSGLMVVTK